VIGDHGRRDFIHFQAAISLGDLDATEAQFTSFFEEVARNRKILVLDLLRVGKDFIDGKFFRRLADQSMLLGEIFRSENFVRSAGFQQKAAAGDFGAGNCCSRRHLISPLDESSKIR